MAVRVCQGFVYLPDQVEAITSCRRRRSSTTLPGSASPGEQRERIKEVLSDGKALSNKRSRIVHGLWVTTDGGSAWITKPQRYRLFVRPERLTIEEMHQVSRDIEPLTARIKRLGANIDHRGGESHWRVRVSLTSLRPLCGVRGFMRHLPAVLRWLRFPPATRREEGH